MFLRKRNVRLSQLKMQKTRSGTGIFPEPERAKKGLFLFRLFPETFEVFEALGEILVGIADMRVVLH